MLDGWRNKGHAVFSNLKNIREQTMVLLLLVSVGFYIWLGYFTPRTEFYQLIFLFSILFSIYFFILKQKIDGKLFKQILAFSVLFRLLLFLMVPNLSDDYFRFIWDGMFLANGENPYLILPQDYIKNPEALVSFSLFENLNSPEYFTIYPPICQFVFAIGALLFQENILENILVMRLFLFLSEIGSIALIIKILNHFKLPKQQVLIYALNPLVIIELTGNLHFEALMVFFLVLSFYLFLKNKTFFSAVAFGFAVGVKLIPLVFLPLFFRRMNFKNYLFFCAIVGLSFVLLFLPFINQQLIENIFSSVELYFQSFEFNASIYYIIRWIGFETLGYNIIEMAGKILAISTLIFILIFAFLEKNPSKKNLAKSMLFVLLIYYLLATTVHPWYICVLLLLSVFTNFRFAILWSFLVLLTYATYLTSAYVENLYLVALEYILLLIFLIYELKKSIKKQMLTN